MPDLVQAKSEQILALEHALVLAEEALAARQEALGECQDMLAEMQGFSEAQRHRADQERAQAQVGPPSLLLNSPSIVNAWRSGTRSGAGWLPTLAGNLLQP